MLGAAPWLGRFCLRWPGLVVFAVVIAFSALLSTLVGPQPHAQSQKDTPWDGKLKNGTVEVSVDEGMTKMGHSSITLKIAPGETEKYYLRLTAQPVKMERDGTIIDCDTATDSIELCPDDGWWVLIRVDDPRDPDDGTFADYSFLPSVGWEFDRNNWNQWREVRIKAPVGGGSITISHEVWANGTHCPVHGVGMVPVNPGDGNTGNTDNTDNTGGNNPNTNIDDGTASNSEDEDELRDVGDPGLPKISIADTTVEEGDTARFVVTLSPASDQTVTVRYKTADGTAAAGQDFEAVLGTLTFGPRTTQQVIAVPTREDKLDEPDETFLVTLSNPNGATIQDGTATGTIADDDVRSLAPINRELLPEIGRALAFTAVRCRIEQAFSDMARGWAEPVVSPSLSVPPISSGLADGDGGSLELEDILANTSFLLPLMGGNGGTIQFSTWGCGDYRSLAGDGGGDAGAWDGEAFSMQVGADAIVGRDLLAGVSLSQSRGSLDFDGPGGSDPAGGRYDLGLTGVHPYLGWWISPDLELWGTFGLAGGDLQVVDDAAGSSATSAATLASATVGINGRLLTYGAATLRLKGEGSLAQLDVSKGTGLFQGASANLQRLRLAAEVEYEHVIPDVGVLVPWGELGLRYEGGDGATGSSLELGGGLHYRNIEQGWNAEVYGRWLAVQDDAPLQEQGFGLRFRYDPETPGFGPWVSMAQTWGEPTSSVHRLWSDGTNRLAVHDSSERRLGVEFGYGFPAFGGRAALMPYGAVSLENSDARGYRLGMRVSLGSSALLSLETERRERPAASADHRIMLRAIARF